jgi:tRNA (guanine-N7-)-methyltransferase
MTEEDHSVGDPRKHDYRQRAHCNPLSDRDIPYPLSPDEFDWVDFFPILASPDHGITKPYPTILDIGCGYGGLSFKMSERFPNNLIMAFEIRCTVTSYVQRKIQARRLVGRCANVAVQWANTMRTLTRYIRGRSVEKMFILFPDPHFKKRKMKWRIISSQLMDEYAFVLKNGGEFYLVTDVLSYFDYAVAIISEHPCFEKVERKPEEDEVLNIAMNATEESRKVARNGGQKFYGVWKRVESE